MGKFLEGFVQTIVQDFKQKELLPVKLLFFVHMSTILVLYPYITIHMRELGINVEETAIMSSITPVVGILMPPLAGLFADKIGNFRAMLALFSALSGLSGLLLLVVPIGRVTLTYPDELVFGVSCSDNNPLKWSSYDDYPCDRFNNDSFLAKITTQSCGFVCQANLNDKDAKALLQIDHYDILVHKIDENKTTSFRYTLFPEDHFEHRDLSNFTNHEKLRNNERYASAIRKLSRNSYYFPTATLFNFSCNIESPEILHYNNTEINDSFDIPGEIYRCIFANKNRNGYTKKLTAELTLSQEDEDDAIEERRIYNTKYIINSQLHKHNFTCSNGYGTGKNHISVRVFLKETEFVYKNFDLGSCASRCIGTVDRAKFCKNKKTVIELDINLTFWTYLAVRVSLGIIGGTAYTMFEGAVIAILREYKADYGLQRMYASLGGMISSPLSGLLIDYASQGKSYTDFRPIFYLYAGLKITSALLMLFIDLEFKQPASSVVSDVMSMMNVELISLFVAVFLLGSAWGYIESFLFWLLQDLGGTKSLMGLTITVGGILGIPLLALSGPIVSKLGHANVIFIGFITYAIRLFGYSVIYNPWLSLIFEAMECFTHSLCFTAAVTYAARLSSMTTDTTIQGILGGLFYGVGRSAGSLVGGYLIKYFGMRGTFQIFSLMTGITAFIYFAFYHLYMKKRTGVKEEEKDEKPTNDIEFQETKAADSADKTIPEGLKNFAYEQGEDKSESSDKIKREMA